jgi:cell shape-determining protein MreC
MRRDSWFLVFFAFVLIVLVFARPDWGWSAQAFLLGSFAGGENATQLHDLQVENNALKSELAVLKDMKGELLSDRGASLSALVYSRYPFGFKNELLINAGKVEGVALGMPIVAMSHLRSGADGHAVLVGSVEQVFEHTSVVKTVFDDSWRSAVRIGQNGVDALLVGGPDPKLTLISKDATSTAGESVYNASPGFPYGIALGLVDTVNIARDQLFHEATIRFPYDVGAVRTVFVLTNYGTSQKP